MKISQNLAKLRVQLWCLPFYGVANTHATILRLSGFCLEQPMWASTRRNIHPLTVIMVINQPLSSSSIYYDPWHPPCSVNVPNSPFPQPLSSFLWSTSRPGTLHFILHTFLHPIIVFFAAHSYTIATCFAVLRSLCHLILVSQPFTWNSIL